MSTADDAWQAYLDGDADDGYHDTDKPAFMFAYRRALEDAADDLDKRWTTNLYGLHVTWRVQAIQWLRDRAAGFGTKDGDDDE